MTHEPTESWDEQHARDEPPTDEDLARIYDLADAAERCDRAAGKSADDDATEPGEGWDIADLAAIAAAGIERPTPTVLCRADGAGLLYPAAINSIFGPSGIGKTWLWQYATADIVRAGGRVLVIDFEDTAATMLARFQAIGMDPEEVHRHVDYVRPEDLLGWPELAFIREAIGHGHHELVVIDSLGEAFAFAGINENNDYEVGPFLRNYIRPIADAGPAVFLTDHSTKSADNPLWPSGSKRKRAAVTGAMYRLNAIEPFVAGQGGRLRLTCAKDRHGHYRQGATVGDLVMTSRGLENCSLAFYPPDDTDNSDSDAVIMARAACRAADTEGRPVSKNALVGLIDVKASTDRKRVGIELAASRGWLTETGGPRGARMFQCAEDPDRSR